MASASEAAAAFWPAAGAAVALLTAQIGGHTDADAGQDELVDGLPPGQVIAALVAIASGAMRGTLGTAGAADVLRGVGLLAATEDARQHA